MKKPKLFLSLFLVIVCGAVPATVCGTEEELDKQKDKKAFSTVDYVVAGTGIVLTVGVVAYCLNKYIFTAKEVEEATIVVKEEISENFVHGAVTGTSLTTQIKKPLVEIYNKLEDYYNTVDKDKLKEKSRIVLDEACDMGKKAVVYSNVVLGDTITIAENLYKGNPTTQGTLFVGTMIEKNKPFSTAVNSLSKKYVERGKPYFAKYMQWLSQNSSVEYSDLRTGYYDFID